MHKSHKNAYFEEKHDRHVYIHAYECFIQFQDLVKKKKRKNSRQQDKARIFTPDFSSVRRAP